MEVLAQRELDGDGGGVEAGVAGDRGPERAGALVEPGEQQAEEEQRQQGDDAGVGGGKDEGGDGGGNHRAEKSLADAVEVAAEHNLLANRGNNDGGEGHHPEQEDVLLIAQEADGVLHRFDIERFEPAGVSGELQATEDHPHCQHRERRQGDEHPPAASRPAQPEPIGWCAAGENDHQRDAGHEDLEGDGDVEILKADVARLIAGKRRSSKLRKRQPRINEDEAHGKCQIEPPKTANPNQTAPAKPKRARR